MHLSNSTCSLRSIILLYFTHLGASLELVNDVAILYTNFNSTFSVKFCGTKAVDYHCNLCSSLANPCLCLTMTSIDLELALQSYDQVFRRLLKYKHDTVREAFTLTVLVDESGVGAELESTVAEYANKIEAFLRTVWTEQFDQVNVYANHQSVLCSIFSSDLNTIRNLAP